MSVPLSSSCETCYTWANNAIGNAEVLSLEYDWKSPKDFKVYQVSQPKKRKRADAAPDIIHRNVRPEYRGRPRPSWRTQGPRTQAPVRADAALVRRRYIYRHRLYSLHVGTNRLSRFRELTPQLLARDEELISRARKWIRRELQVFEFLSSDGREGEGVTMRGNNAEFLLEYIIAILKTVDIKGSGGQAEDMLQEFLGRDHTKLFLHELKAWLRSPYASLQDWDRHVQYDETTAIAAKDKG